MSKAIVFSTLAVCATAMLFGSVHFESTTLFWGAVIAGIFLLLV